MRYCSFELTDRAGIAHVVDHRTVEYTEEPVEGKHTVECRAYPKVFHPEIQEEQLDPDTHGDKKVADYLLVRDPDGTPALRGQFFIGWENLPTYTFDPATREFTPIDPHELLGIKRWFRRQNEIEPEIEREVRRGTELKKLRKAVKAMAKLVPGAERDPDVKEFLELSNYIESLIAKFPKEVSDGKDRHKDNGVSRTRMTAMKNNGIDYGPTITDLRAEPKVKDDDYDGKVQRAVAERVKYQQARIACEKSLKEGEIAYELPRDAKRIEE